MKIWWSLANIFDEYQACSNTVLPLQTLFICLFYCGKIYTRYNESFWSCLSVQFGGIKFLTLVCSHYHHLPPELYSPCKAETLSALTPQCLPSRVEHSPRPKNWEGSLSYKHMQLQPPLWLAVFLCMGILNFSKAVSPVVKICSLFGEVRYRIMDDSISIILQPGLPYFGSVMVMGCICRLYNSITHTRL